MVAAGFRIRLANNSPRACRRAEALGYHDEGHRRGLFLHDNGVRQQRPSACGVRGMRNRSCKPVHHTLAGFSACRVLTQMLYYSHASCMRRRVDQ
jgi:hypothetical protein